MAVAAALTVALIRHQSLLLSLEDEELLPTLHSSALSQGCGHTLTTEEDPCWCFSENRGYCVCAVRNSIIFIYVSEKENYDKAKCADTCMRHDFTLTD